MLRNRKKPSRFGEQTPDSTHCLTVNPPYPDVIGYLAARNRFSWRKRVARELAGSGYTDARGKGLPVEQACPCPYTIQITLTLWLRLHIRPEELANS